MAPKKPPQSISTAKIETSSHKNWAAWDKTLGLTDIREVIANFLPSQVWPIEVECEFAWSSTYEGMGSESCGIRIVERDKCGWNFEFLHLS